MRYVAPPGEAAVRQPVISPQIVFGVDVGQAADHSAIVVVERGGKDTGRKVRQQYWDSHFDEWSTRMVPEQVPVHHVRHIERLPLGTSYVDQAARVTEMVTRLEGVNDRPMVVVDQTGVGRPFCDLLWRSLRSALSNLEMEHKRVGVTITGGDTVTKIPGGGVRVPKKHLISLTQILFGDGRLKIARNLPLAKALIDELTTFRRKQKLETGHESFEHWRETDHDDLVLALALACWAGERYGAKPGPPKGVKGYSF